MFEQLTQYSDIGLYLLRLAVAVVFLVHGLPKLKNSQAMAQGMGWPKEAVMLLGAVESLSAVAMILGIYVQWAAILLGIVMVGAMYHKIAKWHMSFSAHDKTGWEFDLTLLVANVAILLTGGGAIKIF